MLESVAVTVIVAVPAATGLIVTVAYDDMLVVTTLVFDDETE